LLAVALGLLLLAAAPAVAEVEWRARTYVVGYDPTGSGNQPGWALGQYFYAPLPPGQEWFSLGLGIEGGAIRTSDTEFIDPLSGEDTEYLVTHDIQRLLGGVTFGRYYGPVRLFGGVNVAVLRHEINARIFVPELSTGQILGVETETKLGYDLDAGVEFALDSRKRITLVLGFRFLGEQGISRPLEDGGRSSVPNYVQGYLGVGFPFGR